MIVRGAWCFVAAVLLPSTALALPTPDAIVGLVNVMPVLFAGVASAATGLYLLLRRLLGGKAGDFLAGLSLGGFVLVVTLAGLAIHSWGEARAARRIRDIGVYLRCDPAVHAQRRSRDRGVHRSWQRLRNAREVRWDEFLALASTNHGPGTAFLSTHKVSLRYHTGIPAFERNGELQRFEYVREPELPARLDELDIDVLYLNGFDPRHYPLAMAPPEIVRRLRTIPRVMFVKDPPGRSRFVDLDGRLQPVDLATELVDWPVRREHWIRDDRPVAFANAFHHLDDEVVARSLGDEETYLVVPFNSRWRHPDMYQVSYLAKLITAKRPELVIKIDFNSSQISRHLEQAARTLDGRPFVVVGISKYDWVYQGLDFAYNVREALDRDPERFRLLGYSARLPEAAAHVFAAARASGPTAALADRSFATLSGGEKQRVSIASALAQFGRRAADTANRPAEVLLLDEPTASLDLGYQLDVTSTLRRLNTERATSMVVSTHDLNFAASVCDQAVQLRDGRVLAVGPLGDVLRPDTVEALYGVEAAVDRHAAAGHLTVVPLARQGGPGR